MNRRQLLSFQRGASSEAIAEPLATAVTGLTPYTGQWTEAEVVAIDSHFSVIAVDWSGLGGRRGRTLWLVLSRQARWEG